MDPSESGTESAVDINCKSKTFAELGGRSHKQDVEFSVTGLAANRISEDQFGGK